MLRSEQLRELREHHVDILSRLSPISMLPFSMTELLMVWSRPPHRWSRRRRPCFCQLIGQVEPLLHARCERREESLVHRCGRLAETPQFLEAGSVMPSAYTDRPLWWWVRGDIIQAGRVGHDIQRRADSGVVQQVCVLFFSHSCYVQVDTMCSGIVRRVMCCACNYWTVAIRMWYGCFLSGETGAFF